MAQPVKVATPATAGSGLAFVHVNAAPAGVVMVNVTELVSPTTRFPPRSCTLTTGCVVKATPPVDALGEVVKASFAAAPAVMATLLLVANVNALSTACKV